MRGLVFLSAGRSLSLFASAVGVVVWFPLQISERNKTRKGKGEKVAEKEEGKKGEDRTNPGKMTNNGTFLHAKRCLNGCS